MRVKGYKAFDKGLVCLDKQYSENTVFKEHGTNICTDGMMHFCKKPYDVLQYYPLVNNNGELNDFAEVEAFGIVKERGTKCGTNKLKIGHKLSFDEFVEASAEYLDKEKKALDDIFDDVTSSERMDVIGSTVAYGSKIASSGDLSSMFSIGTCVKIGSCGDGAQIATTGFGIKIASSGHIARIGSSSCRAQIGSAGDSAYIHSSGNESKIGSVGDYAVVKMVGENSIAAAIGHYGRASGKKGDWIILAEWTTSVGDGRSRPTCVKVGYIDGEILKEDTFYMLIDGEFKECE